VVDLNADLLLVDPAVPGELAQDVVPDVAVGLPGSGQDDFAGHAPTPSKVEATLARGDEST
jgi:hypothetical protein